MVIRCPQCATRFKVADHLIGGKPVKLKCSKCKCVFTFQRKSEPVRSESASHPRMPVVKPRPGAVIGAPTPEPRSKKMIGAPAAPQPEPPREAKAGAPPEPAPAIEESFESFEQEEPEPEEMKARGELPVVEDGPTAVYEVALERQAGVAAPVASPPDVTPQAVEPASEPPPAASQPSVSGPALTLDDVLPAPEPPSRTGRAVGILSAVLLGLILMFGLFVMWRNTWDFTALTQDPIHAIRVSLGLAPRVIVSPDAKGIDAAVVEWFRARTVGDHELLVVSGEVLNTTLFPKVMVLVEVAIVNSQGVSVFEQEAVAGITLLTKEEMAGKSVLEIREQFQADEKRARSWEIRADRKANFQAFFTSYPPGVDDPTLYSIEAHVTSARNATTE
ncbi:MAG: zinc-ribbon domain-containing protein [Deltaproteobacteria bacterium]|nr:zinc-ribbon domain-containing protein [Deltaproteobacteria bacterium]